MCPRLNVRVRVPHIRIVYVRRFGLSVLDRSLLYLWLRVGLGVRLVLFQQLLLRLRLRLGLRLGLRFLTGRLSRLMWL